LAGFGVTWVGRPGSVELADGRLDGAGVVPLDAAAATWSWTGEQSDGDLDGRAERVERRRLGAVRAVGAPLDGLQMAPPWAATHRGPPHISSG
jgi:hypothetical protein